MRIHVVAKQDYRAEDRDHVRVVPVFEDERNRLDELGAPAAILRGPIEENVFRGKTEEHYYVPTPEGEQRGVLALGLGKREKFSAEALRRSAGKAVDALCRHRAKHVVLDVSRNEALFPEAFIEGLVLGQYRFDRFKGKKNADDDSENRDIEQVTVLLRSDDKLDQARTRFEAAALLARNANWARDLCNLPGNHLSPSALADAARSLAKEVGCESEIIDEAHLERLGMNAFLGVAKGSEQRASLIILRYTHPEARRTFALVGKGITFDTGGISIKPAGRMHEMKYDMGGAAAVLGAMKSVCELKLPVNVVCAVPTCENMISGNAQRPGDIVTAYNGKTIEVDNTDAEGRLILADTLAYILDKHKPDAVVDAATLTGGCVVALGHYAAGLMTTSEALNAAIQRASDETGERVWRLPLWEDYEKLFKGVHADLNNIGPPREASAIVGGCFLRQFVGDTPWAHLDIAGTASGVKHIPYYKKTDATGFGVRLLAHWLRNEAQNSTQNGHRTP